MRVPAAERRVRREEEKYGMPLKTLLHNKQRPLSQIRTNVLQKLCPTKLLFHALPNCKANSTL